MIYKPSRMPKIIAGILITCSLIVLFSRPYWGRFKEAYFNRVFSMCASANGVSGQRWEDVEAFDASVREFVARNKADRATIACANRWAGWITDNVADPAYDGSTKSFCSLSVTVSGQNMVPQEHIVNIERKLCQRTINGS